MELRQLKALLAVVDHGSFQAAAESMLVAQSTVSEAIKRLERDIGVRLFERQRRPARLTSAGRLLTREARQIIRLISDVRGRLEHDSGVIGGELRIGTYPSVTVNFLAECLSGFQRMYPHVTVSLVELNSTLLPDEAEKGNIDCFFRQTAPPVSPSIFTSESLWREPFLVVVQPGHELDVVGNEVTAEDLAGHRLVVTGHPHIEKLLSHPFWATLGEAPNIAYAVNHPPSMVALVKAGLGVGVTTLLGLATVDTSGVSVKRLNDPAAVRDVRLYFLRNRPITQPMRAFIDYVLKTDLPEGCVRLVDTH